MSGDDLLTYINRMAGSVFSFDLNEYLRAADRDLFGFVANRQTGTLNPLFGEPSDKLVVVFNQPRLLVGQAAAGYQTAVREKLSRLQPPLDAASRERLAALEKDFDFFFIADDVLREADLVNAITFHEICHLVEQAPIGPLPFAVDPGYGRELYGSLPDPAFRQNHTPEFCDLLTQAARQLVDGGEPFADELEVIAKAMHYEYEGDLGSAETVLRAAVEHHVRNDNHPTFFEGDYLPRIDSMYRNQTKGGGFMVAPGEGSVQGGYRRPRYVLPDPIYRQIRSRL